MDEKHFYFLVFHLDFLFSFEDGFEALVFNFLDTASRQSGKGWQLCQHGMHR